MVETRQVNLKSRAWHRGWLANSGRGITKHLQNNISGGKRRGAVTIIENFTPRTSLEKQQKKMGLVGREENTCLLICKDSIYMIPMKPMGFLKEEEQVFSSASGFSFKLAKSSTAYT